LPESPRIAALVPMRHHSERVLGKNYRPLADRPLYHHIVERLLACTGVTQVVIDTDSAWIMEDAARQFPTVKILERPAHLRAGTTPMNDVLLHAVQEVPADLFLQTHSTNPLLSTETITRAIAALLAEYPAYDSLFSVTRVQARLWDVLARPVNHNPSVLLRTQDLPPMYEENSCLYLFTAETLREQHNRIGRRPMLFEIGRAEAWDIDDEMDFRVAEFLYLERTNEKS
jgi:CMP-N-acetylneuraminic acid synthetase